MSGIIWTDAKNPKIHQRCLKKFHFYCLIRAQSAIRLTSFVSHCGREVIVKSLKLMKVRLINLMSHMDGLRQKIERVYVFYSL